MSFWLVGAKLVPPELAASYPLPAADGRGWKYFADVKGWAMMREPIASPLRVMSWPLALSLNRNLRQGGDQQGIDHSQQNRGGDGHQERGDEMFFHSSVILNP